jgi:HAD superfamily hydrolase (TIGR01509 family)
MKKFENIKAIILDKDGVFVDFHKLWSRVIACRAQLAAEMTTSNWEQFNLVRTACIRSMGIDEDDETIDPHSPISLPADMVRLVFSTALYLTANEINPRFDWKQTREISARCMEEAKKQLNSIELSEPLPGVIKKIKEIADNDYAIAVFSSDTEDNVDKTLEKFDIADCVTAVQAGELKTSALYSKLCTKLKVKPEETLLISDSPDDLRKAKEAGARTIGVLSGITSKASSSGAFEEFSDDIIDSLAKLDLSKIQGKLKKKLLT